MKKKSYGMQSNLFGESKTKELQHMVKDLDAQIAKALKNKEFQKAKELTIKQEDCIQELVSLNEAKQSSTE